MASSGAPRDGEVMNSVHVEPVDPGRTAGEASRILLAAWPRPCVHYTTEYLRWQFSAPGPAAMGVLAHLGKEPVGFAAVVPRRVRLGNSEPAYCWYLSFVAVVPSARGQRIAAALYHSLLHAAADAGLAIVAYTFEGSAGDKVLTRAFAEAAWHRRSLGVYPVYGGMPRTQANANAVAGTDFYEEPSAPAAPGLLSAAPDATALAHWERHPWPHAFLRAEPSTGAIALLAETATAERIERIPTLCQCLLASPSEEGLARIVGGAARAWPAQAGRGLVMCPNPTPADSETLRAAGLRQTLTRFVGHLAAREAQHPFLAAERTNLSID